MSKLAVLTFETIEIWDTENWQLDYSIEGVYASEIAWHPTENRFAVIRRSTEENLLIWNAETGELLTEITRDIPRNRIYTNSQTALAWSPDGTQIASESFVDTITIWNLETETATSLVPLREPILHAITEIEWSPTGTYLLTGSIDGTIRVWDSHTGDNLLTVAGYKFVAWDPDGNRFAGAISETMIGIWDVQTGQLVTRFTAHSNTITSICWNIDGDTIASTDVDGNLYVWSASTATVLYHRLFSFLGISTTNWRPDGLQLAVVAIDAVLIYSIQR